MSSNVPDVSRTLLAYFSHSYHAVDKEINLFFWQLLSKHDLYFTVDSEENRGKPMYISYLEWMMQRSACFVAVIPRREDVSSYNCSPYQIFENGLAIRAGKPRLIFVEAGLDEAIFGAKPYEVYSFRRRKKWLEEDRKDFATAARILSERAHAFAPPELSLIRPVALLADTIQGNAYHTTTVELIRQVVLDQGYSFRHENPSQFKYDFLFLQGVEQYGVLISEIRQPYITPDVLGLVHGRCIPTIRICHLEDNESVEEVRAMMHLSCNETEWGEQSRKHLPLILSRYEIDKAMEPIIFWKHPEELGRKISTRLQKITEQRFDLIDEQEARNYFLPIGRLKGQVFVSNARTQNAFAKELGAELTRNAVKFFHYKEEDAIRIGREWLPEIKREIRNSGIFIALIDSAYRESEWCMTELAEAMKLFEQDEIEMHVYVISPDTQLPEGLATMQVDYIERWEDSKKIERVMENAVRFLETGKQVQLRSMDRVRIINLVVEIPDFSSPDRRRNLLRDCGLPAEVIDTIRVDAQSHARAAADIVDGLARWKTKLIPHTRALGLFLSYAMKLIGGFKKQLFLASIIRDYQLMPDIRLQMKMRSSSYELGLAYIHEWKELGPFESVERGTLMGSHFENDELGASLYGLSVKSSATQDDWQKVLRVIGRDIVRNKAFSDLIERYKNLDSSGIPGEQVEFCFATDVPGLRVPFEWSVFEGQSSPLCLRHPIRRFLVRCPEPRLALRAMFTGEIAIPLRVLLVASNTGGIPEVENEIEEIYSLFLSLFDRLGWPESNICKLNSQAATVDRIEEEVRQGCYHIFHFAGHGGFDDGKPALQVFSDGNVQRIAIISATMLRRWVVDSDLRFVYLSSCRGVATEAPELDNTVRHFENIAQATVEAHVPEVVSFVWPIEDRQSRTLARRFYRRFLEGFDASLALYHARVSFEEENRIWAAPVLIQQSDTNKSLPRLASDEV